MKVFKNQKGFSDVIVAIFITAIIGSIFIVGVFVWQEIDKQNTINNLYSLIKDNEGITEGTKTEEITLKELPDEFRFDDKKEEVVLEDGYIFINSVLSNDGKKLAYAELNKYTRHPSCEEECSLHYKIKIKDLETGLVETVFDNKPDDDLSFFQKFLNKIVSTSKAGWNGGWGIHLPVKWSNDNNLIILESISGTDLVIEGQYYAFQWNPGTILWHYYATLNVQTKEILDLATAKAVFTDNGDSVVYLESTKSYYPIDPPAPGNIFVFGKAVFKRISDNKEIILVDNEKIDYRIKEITEDRRLILEGRIIEKYEDGTPGEAEKKFSEVLEIDLP